MFITNDKGKVCRTQLFTNKQLCSTDLTLRHFQRYVLSPGLTPCDFFLWGYIKDRVFVPPLPVSLNKLKQRITTAVASVDEDMLRSVWTELDYRIDICRVTKGSHIEHL